MSEQEEFEGYISSIMMREQVASRVRMAFMAGAKFAMARAGTNDGIGLADDVATEANAHWKMVSEYVLEQREIEEDMNSHRPTNLFHNSPPVPIKK